MKLILSFSLFLIGCTNASEHLNHHIVTDSDGCKYFVEIGIGDTVFLHKLSDQMCKLSTPQDAKGGEGE